MKFKVSLRKTKRGRVVSSQTFEKVQDFASTLNRIGLSLEDIRQLIIDGFIKSPIVYSPTNYYITLQII
jgi:hypothetical protein